MTIPAISAVASAPSPASSGTPSRDREQRDHLARRGGARVDPVGRPPVASLEAWWSMITRGSVAEQLRVPVRDRADALGRRAVGRGPAGRRRRRDRDRCGTRSTSGHERVDRRRRRRRTPRSRAPPMASTSAAQPSAAPSVSASGFSWPTASTSRAAPQARQHLVGDRASRRAPRGRRRRSSSARAGLAAGLAGRACRPDLPGRTRRCRLGPRPSTAGSRRGPRGVRAAAAAASARPARGRRRPGRRCRPRGAAGGPASGSDP